MSLSERQRQFEEAVRRRLAATRRSKFSRAFGVSNSAKIIEGGLQLGVLNLERMKEDTDQLVIGCVIRFPPEDEVFFAVQVQTDLTSFAQRLAKMRSLGGAEDVSRSRTEGDSRDLFGDDETVEPDSSDYSPRNNLVRTCLAKDGRLYLRNKDFWETLKFDLSTVGPGARVDSIVVAVYPPAASARRSLLAREFIGYLASFVGRENVHELNVWPDERAVLGSMRRSPSTVPLDEIHATIEKLGGHYVDNLIERYHSALNFHPRKHFVILSGLSGTGKTQLAVKYARAIHGLEQESSVDPFLYVCPVRPEWTDPTGLTGYYDVLSNRYMVPPFLEAVLVATVHKDSPVFVVLDEMNLARVEYYLSDVLSAMETNVPLQLHQSAVPLEGSTGGEIRAEVPLPSNLYLTATINVDETTNPVSDKVLDRAILINMSTVDIDGFLSGLQQRQPTLREACSECADLLIELNELLLDQGLGFGYRTAEEIIRYHAFASTLGTSTSEQILDEILVQKVLVRLRGTEAQRALLGHLRETLPGMTRTVAVIDRLMVDLDETGSFQSAR